MQNGFNNWSQNENQDAVTHIVLQKLLMLHNETLVYVNAANCC